MHDKHLPRGVTLEWGTYYFRGPDRQRSNLGRDFADAMRQYGELFRGRLSRRSARCSIGT